MMALARNPGDPEPDPIDDYHVDRTGVQPVRPATHQVLAVINAILLIILAAVSFSLFWVVATLLGFV